MKRYDFLEITSPCILILKPAFTRQQRKHKQTQQRREQQRKEQRQQRKQTTRKQPEQEQGHQQQQRLGVLNVFEKTLAVYFKGPLNVFKKPRAFLKTSQIHSG